MSSSNPKKERKKERKKEAFRQKQTRVKGRRGMAEEDRKVQGRIGIKEMQVTIMITDQVNN